MLQSRRFDWGVAGSWAREALPGPLQCRHYGRQVFRRENRRPAQQAICRKSIGQARPSGIIVNPPTPGAPELIEEWSIDHHRYADSLDAVRRVRSYRPARGFLRDEQAGRAQGIHQGGIHLVGHLGRPVWRLRRLALVVPRWAARQCRGRCQGPRVRHRLPRREGTGRRQHLRLPDAVHLLRGAGRVPETRPDVRHPRRAGAARRNDPDRRVADRPVPLGALRLRRLPGVHGRQDVVGRRPGAGPRQQSRLELGAAAHDDLAGLRRREVLHRLQRRTGRRRRCSSSSC